MKSILGSGLAIVLICMPVPGARGQTPNPTQTQVQSTPDNPIYRVTINVVERSIKAVNYRARGGETTVDFKGTVLLPDAKGEAKVESKKGYVDVDVNLNKLKPASMFGPEYLTYVMWAITPEGRATNLGEVILDGNDSKLHVTTELQSFGLIVTAEPYFAVTQPSDVVVLENVIRKDTEGTSQTIDAKFDLLKRGQYVVDAVPSDLKPYTLDSKTTLDLAEARNAVRIAGWSGASTYAGDTYQKAKMLLDQAETEQHKGSSKKTISTISRQAVQSAEDARLLGLKRQDEARLAAERQAAANREAAANSKADQEALLRAQSDAAQRSEIDRRARAEAEERLAREKAEIARLEAERARADANRTANEAQLAQQRAEAQLQEARLNVEKAEREKAQLRADLMRQFDLILETRDTARGLILNMSDVLFDTGQSTLKPGAREKLAKVSGILLAHPGLKVDVEGHTDSVGTADYNQTLSERRADSVKTYLTGQGLPSGSITAKGFGKDHPVASNDTAQGRQQNRRVELVVSGDIIGNTAESPLP